MRYSIKESCSCGATLDYENVVEESYQSSVEYRQRDFEKAHSKCRELEKEVT